MLRPRSLVLVVLVAIAVVACATDPRELAETDRTMPTAPTTSVPGTDASSPGVGSVSSPLTLTSAAFRPGDALPAAHTCDGAGTSPPLAWSQVPESATELAVVVTDPGVGRSGEEPFVHWVVSGLDPAGFGLAAGAVPDDAIESATSEGPGGWVPPCPAPGRGPHPYELTLYALDRSPGVDPTTPTPEALAALRAAALDTALLVTTYER